VKIPSTDNQVPRLDFLYAAHSPTVLMSPRQSNSAPNGKLSPRKIPKPPCLKPQPAPRTFNATFKDRVETE
jgi:hypothetical protein